VIGQTLTALLRQVGETADVIVILINSRVIIYDEK
jgi:sulfur carrier protein ThiS